MTNCDSTRCHKLCQKIFSHCLTVYLLHKRFRLTSKALIHIHTCSDQAFTHRCTHLRRITCFVRMRLNVSRPSQHPHRTNRSKMDCPVTFSHNHALRMLISVLRLSIMARQSRSPHPRRVTYRLVAHNVHHLDELHTRFRVL